MSNANLAELLKICKEITEELSRYPGAELFKEPVNPDHQTAPNYYKKIKNPQDLGSIIDRLDRGEYSDVKSWERDMNTIWQNAELYNGKDSYVSVIAHHMAGQFSIMKKRLEMKKISGWMKYLYLSREKLDRLLLSPPSGVGTIFPIRRQSSDVEYAPFSSRELDCLIEASRYFYKPDDMLQMTKILMSENLPTNESENMIVNIDELSPKALHNLRDYFKKKLHQLGQEYPS
ncbi:Bromodomain containing protein [Tritrichomonas foetus]|uniref:Bromodomain containing protein n=1 Tax=Tritrichomonas foetus TaxID=1144522 RepID=A0A1J4KB70_9EUKA|nr:Bromodomain containing protein [Tritrichomonas foetus]|eukprot:OHT06709.1 Bromodomain containing protein [Tritrichomonas foetus]